MAQEKMNKALIEDGKQDKCVDKRKGTSYDKERYELRLPRLSRMKHDQLAREFVFVPYAPET
jgi:hypothetical protein